MSLAKPKRGEPDEALGAGGGGRREGGGEGETKRLRKLSVKRWTARDCRRQRRQSGKNVASFALVIAGLLSGTREVLGADYVDRGEVSMDCDECSCTGPSDDGDIAVFVNPSSGEKVVDVGGSLSKIRETACGMSIISVDDNLYDLSGLDLRARELDVVDMSSDDCTTKGTPESADCYAGSTSKSLSGGVEMDLNICLCSFQDDGVVVHKASVKSSVSGATSVEIDDGVQLCLGHGFISYLVAATVNDETYYYNFDLAISGEDSSEDLDVSSAPPSSAEDFVCDEAEPTLPPRTGDDDVEQAEPTSSPIGVGVSGTAAPQPSLLPTTTTTIAPVVLGTGATASPAPSPAAVTLAPAGVGVATAAPGPAAVPTEVPVATAKPVAAPGGAGGVGGRGGKPTVAPSSTDASPAETTRPPYSDDELAVAACTLPKEIPCTLGASAALTKFGMGIYFDLECAAGSASAGNLPGCGTGGVDVCRTCIFNTPLFNGKDDWEGGAPDFVDCPCCVLDDYPGTVAINEEGPRCQTPSPAPSASRRLARDGSDSPPPFREEPQFEDLAGEIKDMGEDFNERPVSPKEVQAGRLKNYEETDKATNQWLKSNHEERPARHESLALP